ncbi:MAG: 4-(cytidine 5'-diphospho)-2-C-methyl-D-erythritol kinase [Chloroflexi bacterium]|nr:4-(cytidine 5'-diphospho)-2-C-methyl-D-erythritol kinase [Chloroflexota bacterium]OJV91265.1 MAG: 4-(cytidine 5'-diphospho)-2-C-methyl-D-erythritol kinase [Chloroflexi bacterium 54-19]
MAENSPEQEQEVYLAPAKINLSLEVLNRRPDGFHEIITVMQTIGLADRIFVKPAADLQFDCNQPELVVEENLVWRAALLLHEMCEPSRQRGADLYLEKNIPVKAGLGGGSSDAATTLLALNTLWEMNLDEDRLIELAAELGSDVPFFIKGGTVLAEGRGERLEALPGLPPSWLVLLFPQIDLPENKTRELYRMLDRNDFSSGGVTRALVRAITRRERPSQSLFFNSFERVVYERFPRLDYFRQAMVEAGADYVRVSGSGPTLYTLLTDEADAQDIAANLTENGFVAAVAPTFQP